MKKILVLLSSFVMTALLQAENWHVCVGSYSSEGNAILLQTELKKAGYPAFIQKVSKVDGTLHRVLLEENFSNREEARDLRDDFQNNSFCLQHGIKGLWIVDANSNSENSVPSEKSELILKKNDDIPVSKGKPYSVHIQTYREEQAAENDRQRLAEKNVDAYILKKLDKKEAIKFDLQSGAFETKEEAKVLEEKLEAMDLPNLEVTDFNDYAEELSEFDDVITRREIVFEKGNSEMPDSIPEVVQVSINQFPVNENFQIRSVKIFDMINLKRRDISEGTDFANKNMPEDFVPISSAISYAEYFDNLYNKEVSVLVAITEDGSYENLISDKQKEFVVAETDFNLPYGKLHSYITGVDSSYMIQGITHDKKMYVQMIMPGFSKEEMIAFVENSYSDSSLLFYPQIRKSLCIIPDKEGNNNSFLWFNFSKVDDDYARQKNYEEWALKIVGHWESSFYFDYKDEAVSVSLFDLDYDYNAKEVHKIFMDAKDGSDTKDNHFTKVREHDGWYIENFSGNEVSFSRKSYIIAASSSYYSSLHEDSLKSLIDQLKIWQ